MDVDHYRLFPCWGMSNEPWWWLWVGLLLLLSQEDCYALLYASVRPALHIPDSITIIAFPFSCIMLTSLLLPCHTSISIQLHSLRLLFASLYSPHSLGNTPILSRLERETTGRANGEEPVPIVLISL